MEIKIKSLRKAMELGNVSSIEFYKDGSGACFNWYDPTGDHGMPCTWATSLNIEEAMAVIAGFRLKQHELKTCM